MTSATRLLAPVALAIGLGFGALSAPVHAQDSLTRAMVDVAGVVLNGGNSYNSYGGNQRVVQYDAYGRPVYQTPYGNGYYGNGGYHNHPQSGQYGNGYYGNQQSGNGYYGNQQYGNPPYGNAYGYYGNAPRHQGRGHSNRQHRQHDQHHEHDCVVHGECED